ncbi:hypothetical protein CTM93_05940 [Photobacterium phosphoreum]|uniref:hypothetical protein n=1 Tax=Photobacterium phosphoreum TaxID=659 RepID=UPI000D18772C|nr:hypothetical protein [Photobacterium phosphoreum]PSU84936.1 hypothetical protein CTM93_05940 [Photobacterium phosphoreum]
MSIITSYQEPKDILIKLAREGRRTWLANSNEDVADHLFNFCITAHSLRDWCIKYTNANASEFHEFCNKYEHIKWCRDIANSSKHFGLDHGKGSTVTSVSDSVDTLITLLPTGEYAPELTHERKSITIEKSNGEREGLMMFLFLTFSNWEEIFDQYNIPRAPDSIKTEMFVEWI